MKKLVGLFAFCIMTHLCFGQAILQPNPRYDSLQRQLHAVVTDEEKATVWYELANYYKFSRPDSAIYYGSKALAFYRSISFLKGEIMTLHYLALSYRTLGNESKSLKINLECLRLSEENDIKEFEARSLLNLGADYYNSGEYLKAMNSFRRAYTLFQLIEYPEFAILTEASMGHTYLAMNQGDSALYYCIQAKDKAESMNTDWVKNTKSYL